MSNRLIINGNGFGRHCYLPNQHKWKSIRAEEKQEPGPLDSIKPKIEDPAEEARKRKAQEDACLPGPLVKKKNRDKRNTIKFVL